MPGCPMPHKDDQCIGFGEFEGRCTNKKSPDSYCWCDECEDKRVIDIDRKLELLVMDPGRDHPED